MSLGVSASEPRMPLYPPATPAGRHAGDTANLGRLLREQGEALKRIG